MELQKNRIAIVAPSENAYSETFIQTQKEGLKGEVFYYYGGKLPKYLENHGPLLSSFTSLVNKLKRFFKVSSFNAKEEAFMKSLKRNRIQVVLAQYGPTASCILKLCKHINIPLVVHFHGYDASIKSVLEQYNNYTNVFQYASKIIAVSKEMQDKLVNIGCPKNKIVYNPCAASSEFAKVTPKFLKKQFVTIGRFTNKKAPYYTILAFKKVVELHPDALLIMAGEGTLLNTCKNLVSFYKLENNVRFIGVISSQDYMGLLEESLALAQHSITASNGDMEGTPVAILEASAAGLPIVSTFHAGISDVVLNEQTGLLCEEHNVISMSKNMLRLIEDVSLAKTLGAAGKLRIHKQFSLEIHLNKLQEVLESSII